MTSVYIILPVAVVIALLVASYLFLRDPSLRSELEAAKRAQVKLRRDVQELTQRTDALLLQIQTARSLAGEYKDTSPEASALYDVLTTERRKLP